MANPQKDISEWQPQWVALRILDFGRIIHNFGGDDKALAAWVRQFSEDLIFNNTETEDVFTQQLIAEATEAYTARLAAAKKAGKASAKARQKKSRTAPGRGNSRIPDEDSTDCEEFTATATGDNDQPQPTADNRGQAFTQDASTGNGEDERDHVSDDANSESSTSCNHSNGDATRREAADGETDGNVVAARTTVSNPLALDMPGPNKDKATAKTRDNSSSCLHASPSCSPEDGTNAAQPDSPANDQSDRHKRGREEPATDADIRKDSENMTDAGNGGTLESVTSAAGDSFEAREMPSPGEGRKTFATGSSHPVANPPPPFVLKHLQKCGKQKQKANAQSPPRSSEDVRLFAIDKHLDVDDARLWYQMNYIDRPGCDKDGVLILNWKGHCTAYCKAEAERRKAG